MKIKALNWISKKNKEAEVIVQDNNGLECLVFSYSLSLNEKDILNEPLHALEVNNLMKAFTNEPNFAKLPTSYFAYKCVAKIINFSNSLVSIGGIIIDLGINIPSWANEGDYIEFTCVRFDIW